jgi:three-Cys-motif partner protein
MDSIETLSDDNLLVREANNWSMHKYQLVDYYAKVFSRSMKDKWSERIYIDLFSGPGRAKLPGGQIVKGSPLIALSVPDQFDKYVFCDVDQEAIEVLYTRVERDFSEVNVVYICGNANDEVSQILKAIPRGTKSHTVLSFCFLDPWNLDNLKFTTIKKLSSRFMDFLV